MFKNLFCTFTLILFLSDACAQNAPKIGADSTYPISIKIIPSNFYTKQLGVVCTQELRLQKATGVNIFFRLGNKQYVDFLERKPNAVKQVF